MKSFRIRKLGSLLKKKQIDAKSLKFRLTVGISTVYALGIAGLAAWTTWRMQRLLISTHKQNITYIAQRFPHDVKIYSEKMPMGEGIQAAINNLTSDNTLIWVKENNEVRAQSKPIILDNRYSNLASLKEIPAIPEIQLIENRYWLVCATPLKVEQQNLGEVYFAMDITADQTMFLSFIKSLNLACIVAIIIMMLAIAMYVNKAVKPLQQLSEVSANISADRLKDTKIPFNNDAPSEVRQLAQTLDDMLRRLSQAWEHQRQLLSNVSHELRTPLTIVSGYLQSTLRRGNNLTETQKEALTVASGEAERTVRLLQDLLDLARADSGGMHFHLEAIVVNDLLAELIDIAKQYADREFIQDFIAENIVIEADPNRLKQVLLNLFDNAVKYSESGKPITIKLSREQKKACIQICDCGKGIPLKEQARIFERFYRIDEARSRSSGGTGLGLSIVKTLTEEMAGTISLRSELNKGSTFSLLFPLIESESG